MAGLSLSQGSNLQRIIIAVSIHDADNRRQNFGQVRAAFCRLLDQDLEEIVRYDLTEDAAAETAMVIAEIDRNGAEGKFKAVGQGYRTGLAGIAKVFGVPPD